MSDKTNPKYFPQFRGWIALALGIFSPLYFTYIRPPIFVRSGGPAELMEAVSMSTWFIGGLLIVVSAGTCVEALRRGNFGDRIAAGIAAVCVLMLLVHYCSLMVMKSRPANHAHPLDGGTAVLFHIPHHRPAASDVIRYM